MAAIDPRDHPASVVAAERVMLELWTVLARFADAMTIVGGSAPPLLTGDRPDDPYAGTLDVDLVVDPIGVPDEAYRTIAELLRERGYVQLDQPFRWLRSFAFRGRQGRLPTGRLTAMSRSHRRIVSLRRNRPSGCLHSYDRPGP